MDESRVRFIKQFCVSKGYQESSKIQMKSTAKSRVLDRLILVYDDKTSRLPLYVLCKVMGFSAPVLRNVLSI